MYVERVTKVAVGKARNPARAASRRAGGKRSKSVGNPAHLLSLGWLANPKKERNMKRNTKRKAGTTSASRNRKRNPGTKIIVVGKRNGRGRKNGGVVGHRRRRPNPTFFGASVTPMQMGQYVLGGLVGVTINRVVLPLMPAAVTGSNLAATLTAFAIAGVE